MTAKQALCANVFALSSLLGGHAHADARFELSSSPTFVEVAAGATADFVVHIRNGGDSASSLSSVSLGSPSGYTLEQRSAPTCGVLQDGVFAIAPIAAGATLDCMLRVTRALDAADSERITISTTAVGFFAYAYAFVGTFTDIALSSERVSYQVDEDGIAHAVFRLHAKNISDVSVEAFDAMTCSREATMDSAIAGGCAPTTSLCARGFIPYAAQGARLPALEPGEESSCLISLSGPPGTPAALTLTLDEDPDWNVFLIDGGSGGHLFDANPANDDARLPLNPAGGAIAALPAPTLLLVWQIVLAILVAAAATAVPRRIRRIRR